jgi:toxin ParE1/3/4
MKLFSTLLPKAEMDLTEIGDYFDERSDTASQRFYDQFWFTVHTICEFPTSGERFPYDSSGKIRRRNVGGKFKNYIIYYRQEGSTLQIIRVIHAARDDTKLFGNETVAPDIADTNCND